MAASSSMWALPSNTTTVDHAAHALAGDRLEVADGDEVDVGLRRTCDDGLRQRMFALRSRLAAIASTSVSVKPGLAATCWTRGLPSVSVPVLSTTSVSTFSMSSKRLGILDEDAFMGTTSDADDDGDRVLPVRGHRDTQ